MTTEQDQQMIWSKFRFKVHEHDVRFYLWREGFVWIIQCERADIDSFSGRLAYDLQMFLSVELIDISDAAEIVRTFVRMALKMTHSLRERLVSSRFCEITRDEFAEHAEFASAVAMLRLCWLSGKWHESRGFLFK